MELLWITLVLYQLWWILLTLYMFVGFSCMGKWSHFHMFRNLCLELTVLFLSKLFFLTFSSAPRNIPCYFSRSSPNVTFPPMASLTPHGTHNGSLPVSSVQGLFQLWSFLSAGQGLVLSSSTSPEPAIAPVTYQVHPVFCLHLPHTPNHTAGFILMTELLCLLPLWYPCQSCVSEGSAH